MNLRRHYVCCASPRTRMATINIHRQHTLGKEGARHAVERVAQQLRNRLQTAYHWDGDSLIFSRSGADGRIEVDDREIAINIKLGLMLSPMKGIVEDQIERYLDQNLQ